MNNQKWLSLNFFAFFFTWGVFLPYWTGWLTNDKGLSVSEASVIMGTGMIVRSIGTLFFFPAMTKMLSLHKLLQLLSAVTLAVTALYIPMETFLLLLVITCIFNLFYPNLLPALESGATVLVQTDRINYGKSRSFGSIGYTVALLVIGTATSIWQEQVILWTMLAGLLFMAVVQAAKAPVPLRKKPETIKEHKPHLVRELLKSKTFSAVLIASILLQGAHASYYNYGFIYLQELKVNGFYIGVILNVAIIFEILFFTKADQWFRNWPVSSMFLLAGIGSTIRWLIIFLFPSVWMFSFSQVLHAISFGVAHVAFIRYSSSELKQEYIPVAQGLYAALAMSLSVALLTFFGGFLYEESPGLAFLGMTIFSLPAVLLVLLTRKKYAY